MKKRGHLVPRSFDSEVIIKDVDGNLYDLGQNISHYGNFLEHIPVSFRVNAERKATKIRRLPVKKFRKHLVS